MAAATQQQKLRELFRLWIQPSNLTSGTTIKFETAKLFFWKLECFWAFSLASVTCIDAMPISDSFDGGRGYLDHVINLFLLPDVINSFAFYGACERLSLS